MDRATREKIRAKREEQRARRAAARSNKQEWKDRRAAEAAALLAKVRAKEKSERAAIAIGNDFMSVVAKKAPRLLDTHRPALNILAATSHVRPVADWEPKGKGRDTLFRSLCEHCLAVYPTPAFLWTAFFAEDSRILVPIVVRIAKGESFFKLNRDMEIDGPPMTRKMVHDFMSNSAKVPIMRALRRAQIRAHGGEPWMLDIWMRTGYGQRLQGFRDEPFWDSVLRWFCQNPMIDPSQIGPLIDFIEYRRQEDPEFSMKGRSVLAMIRNMHEWHDELGAAADAKNIKLAVFKKSGFKEGAWDSKDKQYHWTMKEILTTKHLAVEGREMRHCVYAYRDRMLRGGASVWSLCCNGERKLTVMVNNDTKTIEQYRGKCNRVPTRAESQTLNIWAKANGLTIGRNGW
jgi:hypothetical protein